MRSSASESCRARLAPPALACLFLLAAAPAQAQGWRWLSPKPQGVSVNAAAFPGAAGGQGWLVGALGTIATTSDGARTFTAQSSGVNANLNGVFFLDAHSGWAVGDAGTILHTSDGGAHWAAQPSLSSRKLRGVWFADALHGLAVGDYRTLLQTSDGGQTWSGRGSAVLSLDAVVYTDAQHAFLCGDSGAILASADGAQSFTAVDTGSSAHLLALAFADPAHGFAVGQGGAVVSTSDSGASWTAQTISTDDLVGVAVLSATQAYALGAGGLVHATSDGHTWRTVAVLSSPLSFTALVAEPGGALDAFTQGGRMLRAPPGVAPSGDGGVGDAGQGSGDAGSAGDAGTAGDAGPAPFPAFADVNDLLGPAESVRALGFESTQVGLVATNLALYATVDRGQHLTPVGPTGPGYGWTALSVPTATSAFAAGIRGTCMVSHDPALQLWTQIPVPTSEDLAAIQFLDDQNGFVAGAQGVVYSTSNGGTTWNELVTPVSVNWSALSFRDPLTGAVGGDFGSVAYTLDGMTLTATNAGFGAVLAMSTPAPGVVIAAGTDGTLEHSFDQGMTFFPLNSPTSDPFTAIHFFDHQNGVLATGGVTPTLFVTHDGAQSFGTQFVGSAAFSAVAFSDAQHGMAGGASGTLLITDTAGGLGCAHDADCASDAGLPYGSRCIQGTCQTCTTDDACGPACQPCASPTATCYGGYCGSCLNDFDCPGGYCELGQCQVSLPNDGGMPDSGGTGTSSGGNSGSGSGTAGSGSSGSAGTTGKGSGTGACGDGGASCPSSSGGCQTAGGLPETLTALVLAALFLPPRRRGR